MNAVDKSGGSRPPLISLRGISKRFGESVALADVDLDIGAAEVHALVGENGAGKSTMGKIIAGSYRPDGGTMYLGGEEKSYASPHEALNDGVTAIAQEVALVPDRSVIENVYIGREHQRLGVVDTRGLKRDYAELAARTGFRIPGDKRPRELSLADQQRVEILRALTRSARVVVMDEPTAALSAPEAEQLHKIVFDLRDAGVTVIYISHYIEEILELADRVTVLRDGRVIRTATPAEESVDSIVTAMLGRSLTQTFPDKPPVPPDAPVRLALSDVSRAGKFNGISLEVRAGEIVGLAGIVGAGRTEVGRVAAGVDRPDSGAVSIDGSPVNLRSVGAAIKRGVAYIPESRKDDGLILGRSAVENMTLPHPSLVARHGVLRRQRDIEVRCNELLARMRTTLKAPRAPVGGLSGGNQQKIMFGRWLFSPPRVLIVDEPTRGVDVGAKLEVYRLLCELAEEGVAILLISSEHEEIIGLAHRAFVMRTGRIVCELTANAISEETILTAALTG